MNPNEEDEDLTPEQEAELDEAIRQADNGETVTWEEFLIATARWRSNNQKTSSSQPN